LAKSQKEERAVFKLFSTGYLTGKDDWLLDLNKTNLIDKIIFYIAEYEKHLSLENYDTIIKWSRNLKRHLARGRVERFDEKRIIRSNYRPFFVKLLYFSELLIDEKGSFKEIYDSSKNHFFINFSGRSSSKPFQTMITKNSVCYDFLEKTQYLPLYRYDSEGNRTDNMTDWGLNQFRTHYQNDTITKENIFHYTYAVLHHPAYREKYALNLKREFPRLPFYQDFPQWVNWGKQLMGLHLNYEQVKKYPFKQIDIDTNQQNKPKLKADKDVGKIYLDTITTLQGIPSIAWDYKLGNRCALEWILDQYKEKKPRDKTIAEKFNTYRFADYKEQVIELLQRVCTVSVETMKIIEEMPE
jgi:predicted helicase